MIKASGDGWSYTCGDGIEGLLDHGPVDHVITDPPYDAIVDENNAADRVRQPGDFGFQAMSPELRQRAARAIALVTRRWAAVFCSYEEAHLWRADLESAGMVYWQLGHFRRIGAKPQMSGRGPAQPNEAIVLCHSSLLEQRWNGGGKFAEWTHSVARGIDRVHPTQKPTLLMRDLVCDFTDPGDLVADPFGGVATTGVAAIGASRRFAGWEINDEHFHNGVDRLRTPIFETREEQIGFAGMPGKGHVARARSELDRAIVDLVREAGADGITTSEIASALVDRKRIETDAKELQRALQRLTTKSNALRRRGKTSSTKYFLNVLNLPTPQTTNLGESP